MIAAVERLGGKPIERGDVLIINQHNGTGKKQVMYQSKDYRDGKSCLGGFAVSGLFHSVCAVAETHFSHKAPNGDWYLMYLTVAA